MTRLLQRMLVTNLRLYAALAVSIFSALFAIQFVLLSNGDVINNYPYISNDGFDWYTEGVYVDKLLQGLALPDLPVLRPPVFVFVTAADYLAGGAGLVLALVLGITIFCTYHFSLKLIDVASPKLHSWHVVPLAIGMTIYPMNFFRPYLLADGLAVALSLASVYLLAKYHSEEKPRILFLSIAISVLAGSTQTYALVPYVITCAAGFLINAQSDRNKSYRFVLAFFSATVLFISFTLLWRWAIPHRGTPLNFGLLELNTHMFGFYLRTWGYYFLPFILFFAIFRKFKIVWNSGLVTLSAAAIVLLFALLCLSYQWQEARFTYYFWPWLMIVLFAVIRLSSIDGARLMPELMLLLVFVVPSNYWNPSFRQMWISPVDHWAGAYFQSVPTDRKLNSCGTDCNGKNEFLNNAGPYVNSTIGTYNRIKGLQ